MIASGCERNSKYILQSERKPGTVVEIQKIKLSEDQSQEKKKELKIKINVWQGSA